MMHFLPFANIQIYLNLIAYCPLLNVKRIFNSDFRCLSHMPHKLSYAHLWSNYSRICIMMFFLSHNVAGQNSNSPS